MSRNDGADHSANGVHGLLRNALHEEADMVVPAGDGLSNIQRRVSVHLARRRWLRPAVALVSLAAVVAAGFGVHALTAGPSGSDSIVPATQAPTSLSASPTTAPRPTTGSATPPPSLTQPAYFYAIEGQRVAQLASRNGATVGYLTSAQPGGGASDPQLLGGTVYYLQGAGSCVNALMSVSTGPAHQIQRVASPDNGYVISGYAVGQALSYFETACPPAGAAQAKLVSIFGAAGRHVIDFPSLPPIIIGDPSYEPSPGGRYLDAIVRTGNLGYLARYDTVSGTSPTPSSNACAGFDINSDEPQALRVDSTGALWIAAQTGSSMQVIRCMSGHAAVAFTVAGGDTPADLSVAAGGSDVLLSDIAGTVWRWDGGNHATELREPEPLAQVTW